MADAFWPLQSAVVQKLRSDAALTSMVTGVYDYVPETVTLPYVSLGSITQFEADAHNQRGIDAHVVLHIWSEYRGNKEAGDILSALDAVLDRQPLAVPGWEHISVAHETSAPVEDPNPSIRHINARYRVRMTKA